MNKTLSLTAITMIAVVMGVAAVLPAAMAEKLPNQRICHFNSDPDDNPETEDGVWIPITVNGNAVAKHETNHGDFTIANDGSGDEECLSLNGKV